MKNIMIIYLAKKFKVGFNNMNYGWFLMPNLQWSKIWWVIYSLAQDTQFWTAILINKTTVAGYFYDRSSQYTSFGANYPARLVSVIFNFLIWLPSIATVASNQRCISSNSSNQKPITKSGASEPLRNVSFIPTLYLCP